LPRRLRPATAAYRKWVADAGVSSTTGWRWVKNGWIRTVNIAGRLYVTREEIELFHARASKGEFAKTASGAAAPKQNRKDADEVS